MQIKSNEVVKAIRTRRGIHLSTFAFMLDMSTTYLSFMENGERKLKPQIIGKILNIVGDLSQEEKEDLLAIKKELEGPAFQKTQNQIMKLICEFFSQRKNIVLTIWFLSLEHTQVEIIGF